MGLLSKKDILNHLQIGKKAFNNMYRLRIISLLELTKNEYDTIKTFDMNQSIVLLQLFPKMTKQINT
jgi:hypothetical protein